MLDLKMVIERIDVLSRFNDKYPKGLSKDSIVVFYGKGEDILFVHSFEVMDEKIYMKL